MAKIARVSINFKLPQPLVEALKGKAQEQQTTATDLVIKGLHHVLSLSPNGIDNRTDNVLYEILTRIEALETKQAIDTNSKDNSKDSRLHSLTQSAESQRLSKLVSVRGQDENCRRQKELETL